jgi:hypothetical protein
MKKETKPKPGDDPKAPDKQRIQRLRLNHLIRMIVSQDHVSQAWTKFMIVIQGGLGTAFGYMVFAHNRDLIRLLMALLVGAIGILTCIICRQNIERTRKWSTFYIRKYNSVIGLDETIYPVSPEERKEDKPPDGPGDMPVGYIEDRIVQFCNWAIILWGVAMLSALLFGTTHLATLVWPDKG